MSDKIGVAISTTGDSHRLALLRQSVKAWDAALTEGASLFVTVDGNEQAVARAAVVVDEWTESVYQVGGPAPMTILPRMMYRDGRLGVAVNKNTGLELLMDQTDVEHLFLSDDDTWPLNPTALFLHTSGVSNHSMVCWGGHRLSKQMVMARVASWTWPRGAVLYTHRSVVQRIGGMVEAFGPGGHEHVEWSRRIHQDGITPALYPTPGEYMADRGMGARAYWHAEDMQRLGETRMSTMSRRRRLTSVRRKDGDWAHIEKIMATQDGDTSFVPYQAQANGRASATLYRNH